MKVLLSRSISPNAHQLRLFKIGPAVTSTSMRLNVRTVTRSSSSLQVFTRVGVRQAHIAGIGEMSREAPRLVSDSSAGTDNT